jgi:hypothetical protein
MKPIEELLIAAIEVVRAWDEKEYLKDSIEQLRTALNKLKEMM